MPPELVLSVLQTPFREPIHFLMSLYPLGVPLHGLLFSASLHARFHLVTLDLRLQRACAIRLPSSGPRTIESGGILDPQVSQQNLVGYTFGTTPANVTDLDPSAARSRFVKACQANSSANLCAPDHASCSAESTNLVDGFNNIETCAGSANMIAHGHHMDRSDPLAWHRSRPGRGHWHARIRAVAGAWRHRKNGMATAVRRLSVAVIVAGNRRS